MIMWLSKETGAEWNKKPCLREKPAGQDAPPTDFVMHGFPFNPTGLCLYKVELTHYITFGILPQASVGGHIYELGI